MESHGESWRIDWSGEGASKRLTVPILREKHDSRSVVIGQK